MFLLWNNKINYLRKFKTGLFKLNTNSFLDLKNKRLFEKLKL